MSIARTSLSLELIVCYYIRNEYENKIKQANIPVSLKDLIVSFADHVIGSSVLTSKEDTDFSQLLCTIIPNIKRFELLLRASEHGFSGRDFHNKCDDRGSTVTIIQSNFGTVFGGYTSVPWSTPPHHFEGKQDANAFLFLIRSDDKANQNKCPMLFPIKTDTFGFNICHHAFGGPCFGKDLRISDQCDKLYKSGFREERTTSYVCPLNYNYGSLEGPLSGGNLIPRWNYPRFVPHVQGPVRFSGFTVLDYEVFQISYSP
eukprot:259714_1